MNPVKLFIEQRNAFEKAYESDDWQRLAPFLSEEITYRVMGMPFHCAITGRQAVLNAMAKSVANFDRHCKRNIVSLSTPRQEGNTVITHGELSYSRDNQPAIVSRLYEVAIFDGDHISELIDIYEAGCAETYSSWMAEWGTGLDAAYI